MIALPLAILLLAAAGGRARAAAASRPRAARDPMAPPPLPPPPPPRARRKPLTVRDLAKPRVLRLPEVVITATPPATAPATAPLRRAAARPPVERARKRKGLTAAQKRTRAAKQLRDYLRSARRSAFGSKARPNPVVATYQEAMGGALKPDGIVGKRTRRRARALGYALPPRPAAKRASPRPARRRAAPVPARATAPAVSPRAMPPPEPKPARRSALQAASDLYTYVTQVEPNPRRWGHRGSPNAVIRDAQADMGLVADGIYGPATRRAGKALLGQTFPARR